MKSRRHKYRFYVWSLCRSWSLSGDESECGSGSGFRLRHFSMSRSRPLFRFFQRLDINHDE